MFTPENVCWKFIMLQNRKQIPFTQSPAVIGLFTAKKNPRVAPLREPAVRRMKKKEEKKKKKKKKEEEEEEEEEEEWRRMKNPGRWIINWCYK